MIKRMRYIGTVREVSVRGKGIIRRGDIVEFGGDEVLKLDTVNWQEVIIPTFDRKIRADEIPHIKKKTINKTRKPTRSLDVDEVDGFSKSIEEDEQ